MNSIYLDSPNQAQNVFKEFIATENSNNYKQWKAKNKYEWIFIGIYTIWTKVTSRAAVDWAYKSCTARQREIWTTVDK